MNITLVQRDNNCKWHMPKVKQGFDACTSTHWKD